MQETGVRFLGQEDPLEEGTATHSSIFVWRIPPTEELSGLQSKGSQRVGHDLATKQQQQQQSFQIDHFSRQRYRFSNGSTILKRLKTTAKKGI